MNEFQVLVWRSIRRCNLGSHREPRKQWKFQQQQNSLQLCTWFSYTVSVYTWKLPSCFRLHFFIWWRQQQRCLCPCKHWCLPSCSAKSLQLCLLAGKGHNHHNINSFSFSFPCFTLESPPSVSAFAMFIFVVDFVPFYVGWCHDDHCTLCRSADFKRMFAISSGFSSFGFPCFRFNKWDNWAQLLIELGNALFHFSNLLLKLSHLQRKYIRYYTKQKM